MDSGIGPNPDYDAYTKQVLRSTLLNQQGLYVRFFCFNFRLSLISIQLMFFGVTCLVTFENRLNVEYSSMTDTAVGIRLSSNTSGRDIYGLATTTEVHCGQVALLHSTTIVVFRIYLASLRLPQNRYYTIVIAGMKMSVELTDTLGHRVRSRLARARSELIFFCCRSSSVGLRSRNMRASAVHI